VKSEFAGETVIALGASFSGGRECWI